MLSEAPSSSWENKHMITHATLYIDLLSICTQHVENIKYKKNITSYN